MKKIFIYAAMFSFILLAQLAPAKNAHAWCPSAATSCKPQAAAVEDNDLNPLEGGVGVDFKVYKFNGKYLDSINIEVRKDFIEMDRGSAYTVLKGDLTGGGQ